MWQFAMNSPGSSIPRTGFASGNDDERRINRLLSLAFFTGLAVLHIAAFSVFTFFEQGERPFENPRELFFTLEFAGQEHEETAQAALPPVQEALFQETSEAVPVLVEETEAVSRAETALAETTLPSPTSFSAPSPWAASENTALSGLVASARTMSDAEYLALIMNRLEQHKIYPLAVRKRGIEGNVTVTFTIEQNGSVSDIQLADPSGHRFLAQAAFETIRSSSPFPVREDRGGDYTMQVTIRYQLEDKINQNN
jgi:TonB family protein